MRSLATPPWKSHWNHQQSKVTILSLLASRHKNQAIVSSFRMPSQYLTQDFSMLVHADTFKVLVKYLIALKPHKIIELYGENSKVNGKQIMKVDYKAKDFNITVHHPPYCEFTIHSNIGKILENKVRDVMFNKTMHIVTNYKPTPEKYRMI